MKNDNYERLIAYQIKYYRLKANLSQQQMVSRLQLSGCDLTRSALAKIESGKRHIRLDELYYITSVLKITPNQILFNPENPPPFFE